MNLQINTLAVKCKVKATYELLLDERLVKIPSSNQSVPGKTKEIDLLSPNIHFWKLITCSLSSSAILIFLHELYINRTKLDIHNLDKGK